MFKRKHHLSFQAGDTYVFESFFHFNRYPEGVPWPQGEKSEATKRKGRPRGATADGSAQKTPTTKKAAPPAEVTQQAIMDA